MSKLMAILVIIFLCISCTDNAELPVKPDKNEGTENVLIELAVTVPAVTYTRTRGIVRTIDHETLINEIQILVFEEGKYKCAGVVYQQHCFYHNFYGVTEIR